MDVTVALSRVRHGLVTAVAAMLLVTWALPHAATGRSTGRLPARCERYTPGEHEVAPGPKQRRGDGTSLRALYGQRAPKAFFDPPEVDLARTVEQLRTFQMRERFVLPSSDVVVVVLSDGDIQVSPDAIDELFHVHMRHWDHHDKVRLRARMHCYADTILEQRAFAGRVVNLYVPADPSACLRHLRLVKRIDDGPWSQHCDWGGVTPPVALRGWLGEIRIAEFHMLIAPGMAEWSEGTPHPGVAQLLRHESDHLWDWMMGEQFRFAANERRAQAGDALVRSLYKAEHHPWPHPFRYPNAREAELRHDDTAAV